LAADDAGSPADLECESCCHFDLRVLGLRYDR